MQNGILKRKKEPTGIAGGSSYAGPALGYKPRVTSRCTFWHLRIVPTGSPQAGYIFPNMVSWSPYLSSFN